MSFDVAELITYIRTKAEVGELLRELGELEQGLYKSGEESFEEQLNKRAARWLAELIKARLQEAGDTQDVNTRLQLLREIGGLVGRMPIIRLEVAVDPSEEMIGKISMWLREKIDPGIILELVVDKSLMFGVKISYQGKYADYTGTKVWEQVWKEIKPELLVSEKKS